jgi:hypothetical protein
MACSKCGCEGIHACIGRMVEPPTPEEIERFNKTLDSIFKDVSTVVPPRTLALKRLQRECKTVEGLTNKLEQDLNK